MTFKAGGVSQSMKRLRRRLRSARRWTVTAGLFGGVTAVLVPYQGLGAPDAVWAGLFGLSAAAAAIRWVDYRRLSKALPEENRQLALHGTAALAVEAQTVAGALAEKIRGKRVAVSYRGSAAAEPHDRLARADRIFAEVEPQLTGPARETVADVQQAGMALHELAEQIRGVERSAPLNDPAARAALDTRKQELVDRLQAGVSAYEKAVADAAKCLAEQTALDGVVTGGDPTLQRLSEASQKLRGHAEAVGEMHDLHRERTRRPAAD